MPKKNQSNNEMFKGTLDMMILRTLVGGDAHGHTIAKVIERTSEDLLEVEQGSLYPALHRLEDRSPKKHADIAPGLVVVKPVQIMAGGHARLAAGARRP